jgi:hypothetical protein
VYGLLQRRSVKRPQSSRPHSTPLKLALPCSHLESHASNKKEKGAVARLGVGERKKEKKEKEKKGKEKKKEGRKINYIFLKIMIYDLY